MKGLSSRLRSFTRFLVSIAKAGSIAAFLYLIVTQYSFAKMFGYGSGDTRVSKTTKYISSLIPTHGLAWSLKVVFAYEAKGGLSKITDY